MRELRTISSVLTGLSWALPSSPTTQTAKSPPVLATKADKGTNTAPVATAPLSSRKTLVIVPDLMRRSRFSTLMTTLNSRPPSFNNLTARSNNLRLSQSQAGHAHQNSHGILSTQLIPLRSLSPMFLSNSLASSSFSHRKKQSWRRPLRISHGPSRSGRICSPKPEGRNPTTPRCLAVTIQLAHGHLPVLLQHE